MDETSAVKKVSPKDVFLHLLGIVTLYSSAIALITLFFQYANLAFPDPLNFYRDEILSTIRFSVSTLIIVFPAYVITTWFLNKSYLSNPERRNLRIRKWLIYFTLFVAALVVIGDLVTLVYNFLGGDITSQFVVKVFSVFFVAGSIFTYYFWDIRKYRTE